MKRPPLELIKKIIDGVRYLPRYSRMVAAEYGLPLSRNEAALNELTHRHLGETAVIIGMGPSLLISDLERLKDVVTFGCNKLYLSFPETSFRPTYYSVTDDLVAKNNVNAILGSDFTNCVCLHHRVVRPFLKAQPGALFYDSRNSFRASSPKFNRQVGGGIMIHGFSICVELAQIAYLMGCAKVYLIGVDFSFDLVGSTTTGMRSQSGDVLKAGEVQNHFHAEYRKPGETWTVPRMEEQRHAFEVCGRLYKSDGRLLLNASRNSKLDVLERVNFDQVFPPLNGN